jgi:hypothetical protein
MGDVNILGAQLARSRLRYGAKTEFRAGKRCVPDPAAQGCGWRR